AECVTTWIAAHFQREGYTPVLPQPVSRTVDSDRLIGYSTFGVSKLALPTRAAMDLAAVGLGQAALKAIKTAHVGSPTTGWATQVIDLAREALFEGEVHHDTHVSERMREWKRDLSASNILQALDTRQSRDDNVRLIDVVVSEWRRLEREAISENAAEQTTVSTVPDSLRVRIDSALENLMGNLHALLLDSPVELAYVQGYGLIWAISALEEVERRLRDTVPLLARRLDEADAKAEMNREAFFDFVRDFDSRGRRGRKNADFDASAEAALMAMYDLITMQARLDMWHMLRDLGEDLIGQIRDVIGLVDHASESLKAYENTCRRAMEHTANQPPQFPAGVALTERWYVSGIQQIASIGQLPPRELLGRVYTAWGGGGVPPERRLAAFLQDIRNAARRALSASFNFADLYQFLEQTSNPPVYHQAVNALPNAATPVMVPTVDDKHPPATPFEIVREPVRSISAVGEPPQGVRRSHVPSPDPDEITVIRVLHGMMAEAIPAIRETYRRAYDRAGAEGMPLHIDRRWDANMADLVHTTARREVSMIWENLLNTLRQNPHAVTQPLNALIRGFGIALDVEDVIHPPTTTNDFRVVIYKLKPFRLKLPPPHCAVLYLYSNRPAEELSQEVFQAIAPLPLEEHFAFVVNVNHRPDITAIVDPLRRTDFTILVLEETDIKHLIGARLPTRALSDMVLDQVNLTTVSPFYTRGPVPEHMFFGREREINEVRSKLRTHSVALIGGRRIGKTSTLQRIQRVLEPKESEYQPYYLDCHGATQYESFFWLVQRRWEVNINPKAHPVQFEEVVNQLIERHPGKLIVLLFDEVDSLLNFDRREENQETLFRTLRSLSNEKRCQYVFSGEKWLMNSIGDPYSALFNFTQAVPLQPLPPKVVHSLVADPFEMLNVWMEQSDAVINRIYQISAGHPNIVQMICQGMVEELDEDPQNASLLTLEHLDTATSHRQLQEQIVQTIWGQMSPLAKMITLIWPEGKRFLTLKEIETMLGSTGVNNIPPELLERTARDLELYCFVRPRDHDRLELIPMAFPAILDFMTDKARQIEITKREYTTGPQAMV
ncbi:MAG: TniB family NTP-binding protein, partial [Anaerolineae bacterium]|nr:TniB family NTP-binding protein [Anaerolineae bacterium]